MDRIASRPTAYAFDISQTDGKELSQIGLVVGDLRENGERLGQFAFASSISVEYSAENRAGPRDVQGRKNYATARPERGRRILDTREQGDAFSIIQRRDKRAAGSDDDHGDLCLLSPFEKGIR